MEYKTKFIYNKDIFPISVNRAKYLREQVKILKKIKQPEQKTEGWYLMRENKITASDIATAIDESKYQRDYILMKKKTTRDRTFITSRAMSWGIKYEDVAIKIYEYRNNVNVVEYGCIPHSVHDWIGASPDGITDDGVMLEIKCPSSRKITGITPHHYWCQVQTQLEVCELDRCDFLECKLEEYGCWDDYEKDNFNDDFTKNSLGLEKGVIVEHYNEKTKKNIFDYSDVGILGMNVIRFIKKCKNKYKKDNDLKYTGVSYWNLKKISCIPIYRNLEWFNEKLYVLKKFWDDVLEYREKSSEELEEYIENKKKRKKKKETKYIDTPITNYYEILNDIKDSSNNDNNDNNNNNNNNTKNYDNSNNDIFVGIVDNNSNKNSNNNNNDSNFGFNVFDDILSPNIESPKSKKVKSPKSLKSPKSPKSLKVKTPKSKISKSPKTKSSKTKSSKIKSSKTKSSKTIKKKETIKKKIKTSKKKKESNKKSKSNFGFNVFGDIM